MIYQYAYVIINNVIKVAIANLRESKCSKCFEHYAMTNDQYNAALRFT